MPVSRNIGREVKRIASVGDVRLHWREDGDPAGAPVVFANSLGTDLRLWDDVIPQLPTGCRLLRFDMRGHGLSSCPAGPYRLRDLVDDVEGLLDGLDVRGAVFVGLSVGGMLGLSLAARRPDIVRGLVLSNSAVRMGSPEMWQTRIAAIQEGGLETVADAVLDRWFGTDFRNRNEVELWRAMLIRTPRDGYIGCCQAIAGADLEDAARTVSVPVLGIGGSEDGASPPETVRATVRLIPGALYAEIPGVGHLPCVEAPKSHAEIISGFLKEVGHV